MLSLHQTPVIQQIHEELFSEAGVELFIKREDLIHPTVSGNKWRKLKYNLLEARKRGHHTLLTFGGAYSNHIYATAAAAKESGFKSIGIIRGEEQTELNPTLRFAVSQGMHLSYMDRATYRDKMNPKVLEYLSEKFSDFYLIPEGGTNEFAIKGTEEIIDNSVTEFDCLCVSVGTGGTLAGMIKGMKGHQSIIGFSALKGEFMYDEVRKIVMDHSISPEKNWSINTTYHFGGYAKVKPDLLNFMKEFELKHELLLDPIYTGKMLFGIYDLIRKGFYKSGSKILAIHTGGLQGRAGFGLDD